MKKFYIFILSAAVFITAGCAKQVGTPQRQSVISAKIGAYEQGLKTYMASVPMFAPQASDIQSADPGILFSYSHSLIAAGDHDQAVFWYYLAQFRAIVLYNCAQSDMSVSHEYFSKIYMESGLKGTPYIIGEVTKQMLYRAVMQGFGVTITQIGIRDTKSTAELVCAALNYEDKHPFKVAKAAGDVSVSDPLQINAQKERVRKALLAFVKDLQQGTVGKKQYLK